MKTDIERTDIYKIIMTMYKSMYTMFVLYILYIGVY